MAKEHFTGAMHVESIRKGANENNASPKKTNIDDLLDLLEDEEEDENMFLIVFFTENQHSNPWKLIKLSSIQ